MCLQVTMFVKIQSSCKQISPRDEEKIDEILLVSIYVL